MQKINTFAEARAALLPYAASVINVQHAYTLERMSSLMAALGNPQNDLRVVHVAGTSGKTSTCYYIAAMLQAAGCKVGLTVSPHISEVNERLQINLKPVPEAEHCTLLGEFISIVDKTDIQPTYFELLVAMAFWYFARQKLDYAVVEVGLGGLLDSTNVIKSSDKICVITDIGLDHEHILGNTLAAIAAQKAGIIQPGNAVFSFLQTAAVTAAISTTAQQAEVQVHFMNYDALPAATTRLPLFQQRNWQLAAHVTDFVIQRDSLPKLSFESWQKTQSTYIPGRLEAISYRNKIILLDGAHNPQKMAALVASVLALYSGKKIVTLIAMKAVKAIRPTLLELQPLGGEIIATSFNTLGDTVQRSASAAVLAASVPELNISAVENVDDALIAILTYHSDIILVTGSFYTIQKVKELLTD